MLAILILLRALFLRASAPPGEPLASRPSGGRMWRLVERSGISRSWMGVAQPNFPSLRDRPMAGRSNLRRFAPTLDGHGAARLAMTDLATGPLSCRHNPRGQSTAAPDQVRGDAQGVTSWRLGGLARFPSAAHSIKFTPHQKTGPKTRRRPLFPPAGVSTCVNQMGARSPPLAIKIRRT